MRRAGVNVGRWHRFGSSSSLRSRCSRCSRRPSPTRRRPGPYLTTGAADQITDTSARVVVYVSGNKEGADIPTKCWVDYGATLAYGSRQDITCAGTFYVTLAGLTPGTTYYYQFGGSNTDSTGHSPTYKSFTTTGTAPSPAPAPPRPPR